MSQEEKVQSSTDINATTSATNIDTSGNSYPTVDYHAFKFEEAWRKYRKHSQKLSVHDIPKVDLHCHLNGSISPALVEHMSRLQQQEQQQEKEEEKSSEPSITGSNLKHADGILNQFNNAEERMKYCFTVFDNIYKIMTNLAFTRMAVQDLLVYSAAENVFVLEIRTSLRDGLYQTLRGAERKVESESITKKIYIETIIQTVEHLTKGGVVDFETGELVPIGTPLPTKWWEYFQNLYGSLLSTTVEEKSIEREETMMQLLWKNIQNHLMRRMHIRLLISINRGHSVEAAMEAVVLAKEVQREQVNRFFAFLHSMSSTQWANDNTERELQWLNMIRHTCWITGIDFSGNCYKNTFTEFIPALTLARKESNKKSNNNNNNNNNENVGLPYPSLGITLHAGEKEDPAELTAMIKFQPERWGHLVFTDARNLSDIINRHDPIELCITSNALTGGYADVANHHVGDILQKQQEENQREEYETCENGKNATALIEILTQKHDSAVSMRFREERRYSRWKEYPSCSLDSLSLEDIKGTNMPNVSFHTDDRGVFGTSVTNELCMLLQHSSFASEKSDVAELQIKAMWTLQRLSLPHVFEIPLEVVLYYNVMRSKGVWPMIPFDDDNNNNNNSNNNGRECLNYRGLVELFEEDPRIQLSRLELSWLLKEFDDFWE